MQTNEPTTSGTDSVPALPPPTAASAPAATATDRHGVHRRLTLNSVSNLGRYAISLVLTFFLTPYIVRTLGDSLYGFWVLLLSFVGYASILEMGVQPAVVKLVGQYKGAGDSDKLRELITAAFLFFAAASAAAAALLWLFLPSYVARFVADLGSIQNAAIVFAAIAFDVLLMFMNYLFAGILYGWQRYHEKNLIDMVSWLVNAALVVMFLERHGMLALAASKVATDAVALLATIVVCFRIFPRLRPKRVGRRSFSELLGFGSRVFVSATSARIATHAQPIIISTWLSSAATAFYAIPFRLVEYARQVGWALTTGFMPMFSELQSRRERAMLLAIYLQYSRYVFLILQPLFVLILVYGVEFIGLWIGPDYAVRGRITLYLLTLSALAESLQPLLWRLFLGVGQLKALVTVSAAASGLVVVSSILLVKPLGIDGVAASVLVGSLLSQIAFTLQSRAFLGLNLSSLMVQLYLRPLAAGATLYGAAELIASRVGAESYALIVLGSVSSLVLYLILAGLVGLSRTERRWVLGRLGRKGASSRRLDPSPGDLPSSEH